MSRWIHSQLDSPRDTGQYIIAGPVTYRRSCRQILGGNIDTEYNNFGGNRQNINKDMRRIYIADTGYKLIQRDQGGADALVVAYLCKAGKLRALFENGIKPHIYNALNLVPEVWKTKFKPDYIDVALRTEIKDLKKLEFWKPLAELIKSSDDWPSNQRYYYFGKKVLHSGNYGMHGKRFRLDLLAESGGTVVISKQQADKFLMTYHNTMPEIHQWHFQTFQIAKKTNQLRNLFGFPLNITWFVAEDDMKDLYAWVPQSTVACITAKAEIDLQDYIEQNNKNWHILAETHDSYLVEAPDNDVEECNHIMKQCLEQELTAPDGTKFRMGSSGAIGSNWSPYKASTNPLGLKEI